MSETEGQELYPSKSDNESQKPEDKAEALLEAYAKILDIWKVHNDNHFKRVQVVMGIIQVGLFLSALKMLSPLPTTWSGTVLPIFIAIVGAISSLMWAGLIDKQSQYLEFCRRTLRNIEKELSDFCIPLEYFTLESLVFGPLRKSHQPYSASVELVGKNRSQLTFRWSGEKYPETDSKDRSLYSISRVAGGMVAFEKRLAHGAVIIWIILALAVIVIRCQPYIHKLYGLVSRCT